MICGCRAQATVRVKDNGHARNQLTDASRRSVCEERMFSRAPSSARLQPGGGLQLGWFLQTCQAGQIARYKERHRLQTEWWGKRPREPDSPRQSKQRRLARTLAPPIMPILTELESVSGWFLQFRASGADSNLHRYSIQHLRNVPRAEKDADDVHPARRGCDAVENQIIREPPHRPETHPGQSGAVGLVARADFRPLRQRAET